MLSARSGFGQGASIARTDKIVTAQHNDYTGFRKSGVEGLESPIKLLKSGSILSRQPSPRFAHQGDPIFHDRPHF
jgi:hypothetical protein